MTGESMVSRKFYEELQHETEALKSHVYRLREAATDLLTFREGTDHYQEAERVIRNETPEQSLAAIQAAAVEKFIASLKHEAYLDKRTHDFAVQYVRRLEQEAQL